jgi:transcriptional regulator with XRE-family HTH domain
MMAKALRFIRVFHDLKQTELANRLGLSKSYLSEIENGRKSPSIRLLEQYAEVFKIPVSSIVFFAEHLDNPEFLPLETERISDKIILFFSLIEETRRFKKTHEHE